MKKHVLLLITRKTAATTAVHVQEEAKHISSKECLYRELCLDSELAKEGKKHQMQV